LSADILQIILSQLDYPELLLIGCINRTARGIAKPLYSALSKDEQPPEIQVEILSGPAQDNSLRLNWRGSRLGRANKNTVQILDEEMSGYHCRVLYHKEHYFISDVGSTNGTFRRFSKEKEESPFFKLKTGQLFRLGQSECNVTVGDALCQNKQCIRCGGLGLDVAHDEKVIVLPIQRAPDMTANMDIVGSDTAAGQEPMAVAQ
jgi:hypothetical protein